MTGNGRIRIVRVIARLNIGGPAIQAITLTRELERLGYRTRLVRGREGAAEGNMDYLAKKLGVYPTLIDSMRRDPGREDLLALLRLLWIMRRDRPHIVHTHAAKAGTLGRMAALLAFPRRSSRPVLVHTFHGHSLTGYFSSRTAGVFLAIEKWLARRSDILVAVSPEVRDELIGMGVGGPERFAVVPLGFDLSSFLNDSDRAKRRARMRAQWGIAEGEKVITLVARLVPIKRVDRFLRLARLLMDRPDLRFVVVGDGELRRELTTSADAQALSDRVVWAGFRSDMADVYFASDLVILTSENEGTPVSLIEAQAAGVPVVGADVGGVRSAVRHGETGFVVSAEDLEGFAAAISSIIDDEHRAGLTGEAGRRHAMRSYTADRLVHDHDQLYRQLLARARPSWRRTPIGTASFSR